MNGTQWGCGISIKVGGDEELLNYYHHRKPVFVDDYVVAGCWFILV